MSLFCSISLMEMLSMSSSEAKVFTLSAYDVGIVCLHVFGMISADKK